MKYCPKCGKEMQGRFCSECGFDSKAQSTKDKIMGGAVAIKDYAQKHLKVLIIATALVICAIVGTVLLVNHITNIFRVEKVEKIEIGMSQADVKDILGDPDYVDTDLVGQKTYYYFEKGFKKKFDKLSKKMSDVWESEDEEVWDEADSMYSKLEGEVYKQIQISFDIEKKVSTVYLDMEHKFDLFTPIVAIGKDVKSADIQLEVFTAYEKLDINENSTYSFTVNYTNMPFNVYFTDGSYLASQCQRGMPEVSDNKKKVNFVCITDYGSFAVERPLNIICSIAYDGTLISWNASDTSETIELPSDVIKISEKAFANNTKVKKIILSENIKSIDATAFEGCTSLEYNIYENGKYLGTEDKPYLYLIGVVDRNEQITFHENMLFVADGAFDDSDNVEIVFNEDYSEIIYIPDDFSGFASIPSNITTISFGEQVTKLPPNIFSSNNLFTVIIPETVVEISRDAFSNCDNLLEIYNLSSVNISSETHDIPSVRVIHTSLDTPSKVSRIGDYLFYNSDNIYYLEKYIGNHTELSLPENINGENYAISSHTFYNNEKVTSVVIPDSVTSIGDYVFANCSSLTTIVFSENSQLASIGKYTFKDCISLTSIVIPDSVKNIGYGAFDNCCNLISVATGDGVTGICYEMFEFCRNLTSVVIGRSVTSIGSYAFHGCTKLVEVINKSSLDIVAGTSDYGYVAYYAIGVHNGESKIVNCSDYLFYTHEGANYLLGYTGNDTQLTLPENYNGESYEIYDYAFYQCSKLTSIEISDSVTSIGERAFYDCSSLTSVVIPDSVTSIGEGAFYDCSSLTSVVIPDGVTSIGDYAFYKCRNLTSITIPDSVTSIGEDAFYECGNLTSVVIGDSVTSIGEGAFFGCDSLTSVVIGDSVTSIGEDAFRLCYKLVEVINKSSLDIVAGTSDYGYVVYYAIGVHNSESKIVNYGDYLFYTYEGANYLFGYIGDETQLTLPENFDGEGYEIYDYAFFNHQTTSMIIPNSVTSIGDYAFYKCSNLTSITIPDSVKSIGDYAFYKCSNLTSITIPDSVKSIGEYAFYECSSLISVVSGENSHLTSIGNDAFNGCKQLTIIKLRDSVTNIGSSAFSRCSALTSMVIPDSVTNIGSSAFSGCSNLTSVVIGHSVTSIDEDTFRGCGDLTSVVIGGSVTSIGKYAFRDCNSLTSVVFGENSQLTSIGERAFEDCSSLTSIVIPDNVMIIGEYAFYDCSSLMSIVIPDSVTGIAREAFRGCSNLTICCEATEEPWGWHPNWNDSNCPVVWGYKGE